MVKFEFRSRNDGIYSHKMQELRQRPKYTMATPSCELHTYDGSKKLAL